MEFDLVVFDWDGTLMDSTSVITKCLRLACMDAGLPDPGKDAASYVIGLGLADALRHTAPGATEAQIKHLVERYRFHYLTQDHELVLFDNAMALVESLKEQGVWLAVATGKTRAGLNRAFDQTGIGKWFDSSRCADECHSKPNPQMLIELMSEFGVDPSRTVMIGDTTHDLLMAQSAGTAGVGLTTGAHPQDLLLQAKPRAIFESLTALDPWLQERVTRVNKGAAS